MGVYLNFFMAILIVVQPVSLSEFLTVNEGDDYKSKGIIQNDLIDRDDFEVSIYPKVSKLTNDGLNVMWNTSDGEVTMMITDVFDKVLYNRYTSVSGKASILDISNLDKGVYKLKIRKGDQTKTLKFVRME